jgi:hypothetical protein
MTTATRLTALGSRPTGRGAFRWAQGARPPPHALRVAADT